MKSPAPSCETIDLPQLFSVALEEFCEQLERSQGEITVLDGKAEQ